MSKTDRLQGELDRANERLGELDADTKENGSKALEAALARDGEAFLELMMRRETLPFELERARLAAVDAELQVVRERKREFQAQVDEARARYEELQPRVFVLTRAERDELSQAELAMNAVHQNHISPLGQREADLEHAQQHLQRSLAWFGVDPDSPSQEGL